jgi:hypothetical protein
VLDLSAKPGQASSAFVLGFAKPHLSCNTPGSQERFAGPTIDRA